MLRELVDAAHRHGRTETETIAELLLGCALCDLHKPDEAEAVFARMIERCQASGDRFHLAAAYGNRAWLWTARGEVDKTTDDLRLVIQIARENGQAQLERAATHNLGEHLLWEGKLDEALQLARRGYALQSRAGEGSTRLDRFLLARVLAALSDRTELPELLKTFDVETDLSASDRALLTLLHAAAGDTGWPAALAGLGELYQGMRIEIAHLAARHGQLPAAEKAEILALARTDAVWSRRLTEF
jgi:tetratricopeptide (TPR) repeat protein